MMHYIMSVFSQENECHVMTNSKTAFDAQVVVLEQLLINQMIDRLKVELVNIEDDTIVRSTVYDNTKEDVELE